MLAEVSRITGEARDACANAIVIHRLAESVLATGTEQIARVLAL